MNEKRQLQSPLNVLPSGPEHWMRWAALAFGLCLAVFVAYLIGMGQIMDLYLYGAILIALAVVVVLGRRAWILIPLGWYLSFATAVLPISFSIRDSMIFLAACSFVAYRIVSGVSMHQRPHLLDKVLWLNLGYLMVCLMINPVGFYILGAETIGARTVFNIALAFVAYWVLVRLPESPKSVSRIPLFLLAGIGFMTLLVLSTYVFPELPRQLPYLFSAFDVSTMFVDADAFAEIPRYKRMGDGGMVLLLALCAYYPPRTLLNPVKLRFYLLILAFAGILASGFRNTMLCAIVSIWLAAWLHRQWKETVIVSVFGALILGLIGAGQGTFYELPIAAQRTLCFLPGKWSTLVVEDAEGSTRVRFEWWRRIISEGTIKNWWFGDGFGTRIEELASQEVQKNSMTSMTVGGSFHNGPLTTIRYCGIFGLILFYTFAITCAVTAVQSIRRARGGPFQPLAVILSIQLIWIPIQFTLVFGAYNSDMPQQIILAGFLRLLVRMLDERPVPTKEPVPSPVERQLRSVPATALSSVGRAQRL